MATSLHMTRVGMIIELNPFLFLKNEKKIVTTLVLQLNLNFKVAFKLLSQL